MTAPHEASEGDDSCDVLPLRRPRRQQSLSDLLASIVDDVTRNRRQRHLPMVAVSVDVEATRGLDVEAGILHAGLGHFVATACDSAAGPAPLSDVPFAPEVVITAVDTPGGLEIEVASSGAGPDAMSQACLAAVRSYAHTMGGSLRVNACPEGGVAMTVCFPLRHVIGLAVRPAA